MKDFPQWRFNFSDDWQEKRLGDLADFYSGGTPANLDEYYNGEIPFIRSGEIHFDKTNLFITEAGLKNSSAKMVKKGDLLFALYGATSGECDIAKIDGAINQAILCIVPKNIDKLFLKQWFNVKKAWIVNKFLQGGQGNLSATLIKDLNIKLPSLAEQKEIGEYFSHLDATISAQEKELESWRLIKKGLLQKIFSRQYKFIDDAGNFYPDWQEKTLGEVCKINPKNEELPPKFQYIDLESVTSGKLTKIVILGKENAPSRAQRLLKINDVIFQMVRPYQQNNYIYKAKTDLPVVSSTGYAQLRAFDFIDPQFLYHSLHTENFKNQVLFRCVGGAYPAINATDLSEITLKIPCIEEQKKIGKYLSELDNIIAASERILNGLKEMKRGLLQKLFM